MASFVFLILLCWGVIKLSVVMLTVIQLNVVAPYSYRVQRPVWQTSKPDISSTAKCDQTSCLVTLKSAAKHELKLNQPTVLGEVIGGDSVDTCKCIFPCPSCWRHSHEAMICAWKGQNKRILKSATGWLGRKLPEIQSVAASA